MIEHIIPLSMVVCLLLGIFSGYPVTFVLGGVGILFAFVGGLPFAFLKIGVSRIYAGVIENWLLLAVPLFVFMKDAYWLGVNYGVSQEAKRLGAKMQLVEAGGYTELNNQISQIEDCVAAGADAVVIGAISFDGLNNIVKEVRAKNIPVIDVINGMVFFRPGDIVKWKPIDRETYDQAVRDVESGTFEPRIRDVVFSLEDFNKDVDGTNSRLLEVLYAD